MKCCSCHVNMVVSVWEHFLTHLTTHWTKKTKKKKKKNLTKMQMVIFDFCIMRLTWSTNGNQTLNQTFWTFCMVGKKTSRWSVWNWPILQKYYKLLIIRMQSGHLQAKTRSISKLKFHKSPLFGKLKILGDSMWVGHHSHIFDFPEFKYKFLSAISSSTWWAESNWK